MNIASPGGVVYYGMSVIDTMNTIAANVATLGHGLQMSMGAMTLINGEPGMRFALPNSRIMIHQPMGGAEGQATDIKILAEEILRMKKQLNTILAKNTKQTLRKIEKDTDRNFFMNADEAKTYGIIDTILVARKK